MLTRPVAVAIPGPEVIVKRERVEPEQEKPKVWDIIELSDDDEVPLEVVAARASIETELIVKREVCAEDDPENIVQLSDDDEVPLAPAHATIKIPTAPLSSLGAPHLAQYVPPAPRGLIRVWYEPRFFFYSVLATVAGKVQRELATGAVPSQSVGNRVSFWQRAT